MSEWGIGEAQTNVERVAIAGLDDNCKQVIAEAGFYVMKGCSRWMLFSQGTSIMDAMTSGITISNKTKDEINVEWESVKYTE